ncbi:MAG: putative bifunctional diguanylate cyclase/phosphodiesterase [Candidatus Velamenicoccus archaeovorus]
MKQRAWLVYLVVGGAVLALWELVPGLKVGPLFNLIALSSPVAILIAARLWKPEPRTPWLLFALGQTLFVAGDVITYNYDRLFGTELPFPSIGDVAYLAVYPCLIAGILMLVRRRSPGRDRESLIDSLIVAVGVGTVSWIFLMSPIAKDAQSTPIQKLVSSAYPFMDLVLLTVVVRMAIGAGRRGLSFALMAAAALALFATDFAYSYISVQGIVYDQAGVLEAGWAAFYLLWGAAALHGSMTALSERAPDHEIRLTRARLVVLGAASLTAQFVRVVQLVRGRQTDLWVITGATIVLFVLVVIRMSGLVRKLELSYHREKTLRSVGAALVTATNREGIYRATLEAARTLTGGLTEIRLLVSDGDSRFAVAASSGGREQEGSATISLDGLPGWMRARLLERRATQNPAAASEVARDLSLRTDGQVLVAPLFLKGELAALLVVTSPTVLTRSTCEGLDALCSQVALALESAALTEDLLRRRSEARFSSLVQNSSDVVMVVDADSTVRYVSPSVERVLGYPGADLEGVRLTSFVHPEDKAPLLQFLTSGGHDDGSAVLTEFRIRHHDDFWLHVETLRTNLQHDPTVGGIVLNTRDISERKAFEEALQHQAFHDPVTNLANRALFRDRVEHAIERQTRDDRSISVLFMDLDDFKTINDSLGHAVGDQLLAEVGERLKACLRTADTAARLGGDEFAILLEDGGDAVGAADVASRILHALDAPFRLEGKDVFVRASIGIATADPLSEAGAHDAEELLRDADVAMYMAKEAGKSRYQVFEPAMHDTALKRLELKADLQRAIDNDELVLHYQPVIELGTGAIAGLEALLRWNHPERGMVPPLDFIPLAEETGLIVPIGRWVLREACRQAVALQRRFPVTPPLHMAVNLSARQLQRPEIVDEVAMTLAATELDPHSLVLEITESVMMQDVELSLQRLRELKGLGVRLAVDDFGTGYSSLNYIQQFPVDILKVDKSFVDAFNVDARKSALTATIIKLAEDLELAPVAEGIERADQLERLLELRCDLGQGFYFARPLPMDGVDELLSARTALEEREPELSAEP